MDPNPNSPWTPALFRLQLEDQVSSLNRARIRTGYRLNLFFGLDLDPYCEWTPIQGFFITVRFRSFIFVSSFHGGFIIKKNLFVFSMHTRRFSFAAYM